MGAFVLMLPGCAYVGQKLDDAWRVADPAGYHRMERERNHEHAMRIRRAEGRFPGR